jgi:hypothetical protein
MSDRSSKLHISEAFLFLGMICSFVLSIAYFAQEQLSINIVPVNSMDSLLWGVVFLLLYTLVRLRNGTSEELDNEISMVLDSVQSSLKSAIDKKTEEMYITITKRRAFNKDFFTVDVKETSDA